ncbi:exportin-T [Acrasis kona]|uniref:Exportin-T n=1 Tax=Acrasis kona TaxID=1008807 RepID=A0AAW2ZIJ0_9EUKA
MERLCRAESRPEVKFWSLQTLTQYFQQRSQLLQPNEVQLIKQGMMSWITEIVAKREVPSFVKGKFAQALVILFKTLYPTNWPTFFKDLFSTLNLGEAVVDLYVRILEAIDDEIVTRLIDRTPEENKRTTLIKDNMREDCIPEMVKTWYTIIEAKHPTLSPRCLKVMPGYIDWIDINLITTDSFMGLFFSLMKLKEYRNEVCDCLYEICIKGMPAVEKVNLLSRLQLPNLVSTIQYNSDEDDMFSTRVAKLTNAICVQLLECWEGSKYDQTSNAYILMTNLIPLVFKLFGDEDDETSGNVITFINNYMMQLKLKQKAKIPTNDIEKQHVASMLQIIRTKCRYRDDYNFDPLQQDEYEVGFTEYRRELLLMYKNSARLVPDMVREFTKGALLHGVTNLQTVHFSEVEIGLALFYHIGEMFNEDKEIINDVFFQQCLTAIIEANVSTHPHESVQLMYFEICGRYCKLLTLTPHLIVPVLGSFVDERGLRNKHETIRSRTTFLLLRLVKALQNQLYPYVENLYQYLKEFLIIDVAQIQSSIALKNSQASLNENNLDRSLGEKLFLFEAMGNVLSNEKVVSATRTLVLEQMLQPLLTQMDQIISGKLYNSDTTESPTFSTLLAYQIEALVYLSKGFTKGGAHLIECRSVFKKILLHNVVAISKALPNQALVAEKVILYLHRMISLFTDQDVLELFPLIVSQLFHAVQINEQVQLKDVVVLINQLITKYGTKCATLINDLLMPLVGKLFQMIDAGKYDQSLMRSEEIRQKVELHKSYFNLINNILGQNIAQVLTSSKNVGQLDQILETLIQGCNHTSQPIVKICFSILNHIVKRYTCQQPTEFNQLQGFEKYVLERIVPTCFAVPMNVEFELGDGINNQTLGDIALILKELVRSAKGQDFVVYLMQNILPQLNVSHQVMQIFIENLTSAEDKVLKRVLKDLFKQCRQQQQWQQQNKI